MNDKEIKTDIKEAYCYSHKHYCDDVFLKNSYKQKLDKIKEFLDRSWSDGNWNGFEVDENTRIAILRIIEEG